MDKEDLDKLNVAITDEIADDVWEVTRLLRDTWLETYPNEEHGITRAEILERYDESNPEFVKGVEQFKDGLEQSQKDPNRHSWIAKIGDKIVGYCSARKGEEGRIQAIYVHPDAQGKKVGGKLIQNALGWIGEGDIYVNVASYNQNAINFYERFGFIKTGKEITEDVGRFKSGAVIPEIEMVRKNG